jgi:hypothetical protein
MVSAVIIVTAANRLTELKVLSHNTARDVSSFASIERAPNKLLAARHGTTLGFYNFDIAIQTIVDELAIILRSGISNLLPASVSQMVLDRHGACSLGSEISGRELFCIICVDRSKNRQSALRLVQNVRRKKKGDYASSQSSNFNEPLTSLKQFQSLWKCAF